MTEELSGGGHILDDSSQGSDNPPTVRGEKEKESLGSTQDELLKTAAAVPGNKGRKRTAPSLAKGTKTTKAESCPIKKIAKRKKVSVKTPPDQKPTPTTTRLNLGRDQHETTLTAAAAEPALGPTQKQALVEALCLSVKQTNYHMSRSHAEIPETQSLEF